MAVALGVAGLLPGLPFIGSVAAPVCGYVEAETLRQQRPVTHVTS